MQTEPTVRDTFFVLAFESLRFQLSTQDNEEFLNEALTNYSFLLAEFSGVLVWMIGKHADTRKRANLWRGFPLIFKNSQNKDNNLVWFATTYRSYSRRYYMKFTKEE